MVHHPVGIRSLAVILPSVRRTNDYYREKYPDLVAQCEQKSLARLFSLSESTPSNEFDQEMMHYLKDPFRGTVERWVLGPNESSLTLEYRAAKDALNAAKLSPVVNQPNLGKFPVTGGNSLTSNILSKYSNAHNSQLSTNLNFLSQKLNSDINIFSLDVNSLYSRIIADPGEFGFTNVTDSCIGKSSVVPINIPEQPVACAPDEFLFWDQVHPTTATHKLIAELAFSQLNLASVPEPSTVLGVILAGSLGSVALLKRS